MVPYIAALIVLIVAILFAVYKRVDSFTATIVNETMTLQSFLETLRSLLEKNKVLKRQIETSSEFADTTLTLAKAKQLGFDRIPSERPFSKALSTQLETDIIAIGGMINMFERAIASGSIQPTQLVRDVLNNNSQVASVYAVVPRINDVVKAREDYLSSKLTARSASGSSGSGFPSIDMNDLFSAVSGSNGAIKASEVMDVNRFDSMKGKAPETTPGFTKEVEDRIAKSVATQLKDSLLAQRSTQMVPTEGDCPYAQYQTNAVEQGKEYTQARPSPTPDMSEYIRKDSIPCWNCSLP